MATGTSAGKVAGAHLTASVPTGAPSERADAVRARIVAGTFDSIDTVWVLDEQGGLAGVVSIGVLLRAPPEATLGSLATTPPDVVEAGLDQERVAVQALAHDLDVVPVRRAGRFAGVVPARALLGVLHREHVEDLHRMVGITRDHAAAERAYDEPATRSAAHRLPWLAVGLGGSLFASGVMGSFEETLRRDLSVAFFVPAIVYIADAVGTQTEALVVRGLALGHEALHRVVLRELGTGVLLGVALGAAAAPAVALLWGNTLLGVAVGISVLVACSLATFIGMVLPWTLSAVGADPALGSGPLATIIQDVLSIVVYLAVVRALLG